MELTLFRAEKVENIMAQFPFENATMAGHKRPGVLEYDSDIR